LASSINKVTLLLNRLEQFVLVFLLMVLIGFSFSQIVMRNLFESGFLWGEQFIRILVLWLGLLGAIYAGRENKHIRIDLASHYFSDAFNRIAMIIANLVTAVICAVAGYYSLMFVNDEYHEGGLAFANIPVWITEAIIPFAFALLSLRFILYSLQQLFNPNTGAEVS